MSAGFVFDRSAVSMGGDLGPTLLHYAAYLSHWSLTFTAIVFSLVAYYPNGRRAAWWVGQGVIINIAMSIGYWSSASWPMFVEQPFFLQLVHGVLPVMVTLYWFSMIDHGHTTRSDTFVWLALPLIYTFWMESYGYLFGFYPYWQLNPASQGRLYVILSVIEILIYSAVASRIILFSDQYLSRNAKTTE